MADFRLAAPAAAQIDSILDWSEGTFGTQASARYAALLVSAMADVADDPRRPAIIWKRWRRSNIGLYHIGHSRERVPDPPGQVGEPRHYLIFRVGADGIVDILGFVHERMLLRRALRQILDANRSDLD
jgi:toxin ParE1/3/4